MIARWTVRLYEEYMDEGVVYCANDSACIGFCDGPQEEIANAVVMARPDDWDAILGRAVGYVVECGRLKPMKWGKDEMRLRRLQKRFLDSAVNYGDAVTCYDAARLATREANNA